MLQVGAIGIVQEEEEEKIPVMHFEETEKHGIGISFLFSV
jgi:hypothetical protein